MNQDCACLCDASRFRVAGNPIGRFFCHCTICQKVYGKPFADVAYFRADAVAPPVGQPVEFRRYRPPPALRRGICGKCGNPVVAFLTMVPGLTVAFVPSQNFPRPVEDRHISITGASPTSPTRFRSSAVIGRARPMSPGRFSPTFLEEDAPPERARR
jgi:hypothetical protein